MPLDIRPLFFSMESITKNIFSVPVLVRIPKTLMTDHRPSRF